MLTKEEISNNQDVELYNDFLNGDQEAFNIIIRKYRKNLIAFIMRYVKRIDIAEDLAQDAFVYILVNRKSFNYRFSLKTYLFIIAKSRALNYIKREKRSLILNEEYLSNIEDAINIEENFINTEKGKEIWLALNKLKKEYQLAIYLKDFQGFQYKEISKILNKTMSQTKMLIHRARKSLKRVVKGE